MSTRHPLARTITAVTLGLGAAAALPSVADPAAAEVLGGCRATGPVPAVLLAPAGRVDAGPACATDEVGCTGPFPVCDLRVDAAATTTQGPAAMIVELDAVQMTLNGSGPVTVPIASATCESTAVRGLGGRSCTVELDVTRPELIGRLQPIPVIGYVVRCSFQRVTGRLTTPVEGAAVRCRISD